MHKAKLIAVTLVVSAGAIGTTTHAAASSPGTASARFFVECKQGYTDLTNGYGGNMCVPNDAQFCPGEWVDHDGDGNLLWDHGECYYSGGELYPAPPGGAPTDPPTTPPATPAPTDPPTTPAPTAQPTDPATSPPTDPPTTPPATAAPTDPPTTPAPTEPLPLSDPIVTITSAAVACDGMVRVEYETAANPAPADEVGHLIVFNPTSNPVDFHVAEYSDRDPHGTYTFEQLGSVDDSYRVFVTVVFDPANPDAVALTDWALATLAEGC